MNQANHYSKKSKVLLPIALLTLASCTINVGTNDDPISTSELEQSTPTLSGVTQPPLPSEAEYGEAYLTIVNTVNCIRREIVRIEEENSVGENLVDVGYFYELTGLFRELSNARVVASRELFQIDWPISVKQEVLTLAESWEQLATIENGLGNSQDVPMYNRNYERYINNNLPSNPQLIRSELNLGSSDITDRC
jgi:hypothetical protein